MFQVNDTISLPDDEIQLTSIRAQGAGGQNVNKVSSAIHLRFDIKASSLPEECKQRMLARPDRRVSTEGVLVIKAQRFRTREKNVDDALARLRKLVLAALVKQTRRVATKPTWGAGQKRMDGKTQRGRLKQLRSKVQDQ